MGVSVELVLFGISILFFLSILAGKAGYKFGVPALLLFLGVGMLFGSDGFGIEFENIELAQTIGTVALCIILFSGGMDTKIDDIKPIAKQGVILATIGVLLTAIFTGLAVWYILGLTLPAAGIGLLASLLLASVMSSTDSASVFSILRSKGLHLKNNLRPMLELESGSNDPMAYVLTITLIGIVGMDSEPNYLFAFGNLLIQLIVGCVSGYYLGKLAVFAINKMDIDNKSLYPIMVFTFCIFIFSFTYFVKGNGFLAVYVGGLVLGNSRFVHKRSAVNFFDGMAWMSQLLLFLTLGLLINPTELLQIIVPGLIISLVMILLTRPLSVFISLLPFTKMSVKDKTFISWVGLRGAVPIIFAIMVLAADVPNARLMFNIVFFCTLVSLIIQGTTLSPMAKWLGLVEEPSKIKALKNFDIEFSDEIKSITSELKVTKVALENGSHLMDLRLPEKTIVVMVKRGSLFFVPNGKTQLMENDKLLVITDDYQALSETYERLGIV
ncbi:potassium/proton antiporter [Galbibacter marinus]|uniref:Potassium/proton antiporter n=1 Tax=Galbibacter marinus TaxID=555500 RepID=K2QNG6_9FLAO|nr:potassium/proton antiporter [Galbibacter marinus]EKF56417.1 potassium/proton antiporter [Galbibacter marinus]